MSSKTWLTGLALGAVLALGGATTAKAQNCTADGFQHEQRVLNKVIYNHGYYSPEAQAQRRKMQRIRGRCNGWGNNGWGWWRGDGDNDRDDQWVRRDRDWDHDRWRRGDGDDDRDDHWRRGDGDHDRDDRWFRRHRGDGDHDRDDRGHRDRDRDHDRGHDRD